MIIHVAHSADNSDVGAFLVLAEIANDNVFVASNSSLVSLLVEINSSSMLIETW